jgi:hypothetical protein
MLDIKRIEVGNSKYDSMTESSVFVPNEPFDFSGNNVTFDTDTRTFDETK